MATTPNDPPAPPPEEPTSPPAPAEPPTTMGPGGGEADGEAEAKPSAPGPVEPKTIAASILPQRRADAARHPRETQAGASQAADDAVAAAVQTARQQRAAPANDQADDD